MQTKEVTPTKIQNTALLFIIIAPITILFYASYVFNPIHAGNVYLYILQIIADFIAIIILGTVWLTILLDFIQPYYHKREIIYNKKYLETNPVTVDVLIPVANEPIQIVEKTVQKVIDMDYPHQTFVLDDGSSEQIKTLANQLGVNYISRPHHQKGFAKSGNLNYGLKYCQGDFFAVFDADFAPRENFLTELLPFFENGQVALVQTPQYYTNINKFIASGTSQAQEIFYKYVQPAKNSYNAAFCVGTNVIYRRSAIDSVGGIALLDHSEDIWTTILLHEGGFETIFYNKVLAHGRAPESIEAFFRQQNRWAQGGFSLFFTHNPLFIEKLTLDQRLQYFFSNIHYFSAFSILIYLSIPLIFLLFGIHPMNIRHGEGWLIHYLPYFVTVYFLPLFLLDKFSISTISISVASFVPYLQAFFSVALKNQYKWVATEAQTKQLNVTMFQIWPLVFIIFLSPLATVIGWYNSEDFGTTLLTTFWVLLNCYFLVLFIQNSLIDK